jgi:hypothetical protein
MCSPAKQELIERKAAFYMDILNRVFISREFNEDLMENMDETHFLINMDNKKTFAFREDKVIKYSNVISSGEWISMCFKISSGVSSKIQVPFFIFKNNISSYPI